MRLLLVGCGKMGSALHEAWVKANLFSEITIIDPYAVGALSSADLLPQGYKADILLFAVKPQMIDEVIPSYPSFITDQTLILSIIAGKPLSYFESKLHSSQPIIRTMPNTPAAIGCGITACFANAHVTHTQRDFCETLFKAAGEMLWLETEEQFHLVTALSGGGPAYQFLFTEYLAQAAASLGLPHELALKLAKTTMWGSAELMHVSDQPLDILRQNVTSPKGTTEAALKVLMDENGLYPLLEKALKAANNRSQELQ